MIRGHLAGDDSTHDRLEQSCSCGVVGFEEFTDVQAGLAHDVDRLVAEFEGIYERAQIERIVSESAKQLEGAAVASFVPILAHRFARERLRAQAQAEGKLAKDAQEIVFVSITGANAVCGELAPRWQPMH
jgi:hypothetical protein